MKVLLIKDVYKLGHSGDVKKVADGYGRNFLLPQGLAVLATPGALKGVDRIKAKAAVTRAALNEELGGLAELISGVELAFTSKAGETGKLYGSVTSQMIADAINSKLETKIDRHQVEVEPIRVLGEHTAHVRLTIDLTPKVKVMVYREGEAPVETKEEKPAAKKAVEAAPAEAAVVEAPVAEAAVVEAPVEEAPVVEAPVEEAPAAEAPVEETPAAEEPAGEEKAE
jgi:large subunit ribosomal protein L9